MAVASPTHVRITANVIRHLGNRLDGSDCLPYGSDLRIGIPLTSLYTYPDVAVVCGQLHFADEHRDTVTNPILIVEVLSDSTEAYDRGHKFEHYRTLPSLKHYVVVAQNAPLVDVFTRANGDEWALLPVRGLDAAARLDSLGVELPLREIYDRVEFTDAAPLKPIKA